MIHVISIKKKQFHFFLLSILVSAVITFFLNIYIDKNKETFTENCSKYLLLNIENKYNSQILNNYVNIVFEREKLNLKLKFDDIDIQTNKIFTKNGSDCEKKIKLYFDEIKNIELSIKNKLIELINNLKELGSVLPIQDQVMSIEIQYDDLIDVRVEDNIYETNKTTKIIIQFFVILLLINFLYFIGTRFKIYLK